jgi:hypothetical protein
MLNRGWDREFRGLAVFDLSTGLFVPFLLATSCVVIASAAQFHAKPADGLPGSNVNVEPPEKIAAAYEKLVLQRVEREAGAGAFTELTEEEKQERVESLPEADKMMAAVLVKRDAFNLADSLSNLTGKVFSHYVFGIGVVGMAISSIIILMLINGFVLCEMLGKPWQGWPFRIGTLMPCIGIIAPFIWTGGKAQFWLAIPTSVFGMALLPVAYFTFFLLMNKKSILGADRLQSGGRWLFNLAMLTALSFALLGSIWSMWSKAKFTGLGLATGFLALALIVQTGRAKNKQVTYLAAGIVSLVCLWCLWKGQDWLGQGVAGGIISVLVGVAVLGLALVVQLARSKDGAK